MSASSTPTRRPRSRRPSARLTAVVDLPTPPLPEATAITAATPGTPAIDRDGAPVRGAAGGAPFTGEPPAGEAPPERSAVSPIRTEATPGIDRISFSACLRTASHAGAALASTV